MKAPDAITIALTTFGLALIAVGVCSKPPKPEGDPVTVYVQKFDAGVPFNFESKGIEMKDVVGPNGCTLTQTINADGSTSTHLKCD